MTGPVMGGYSLPFSPSGRASLLPEPPYHTGRTAIAIHFRADPDRVAAFIPDPLKPGPTSDQGFVMFLDHVMPGDPVAQSGRPLVEAPGLAPAGRDMPCACGNPR